MEAGMSDDSKDKRVTFEIIFWAAVVVVALLYISYVLVPKSQDLARREAELKVARDERERLSDELARKQEVIQELKGPNPPPDVSEREMRRSINWRKEGEVRISLQDD
jgi:hypothetical protein